MAIPPGMPPIVHLFAATPFVIGVLNAVVAGAIGAIAADRLLGLAIIPTLGVATSVAVGTFGRPTSSRRRQHAPRTQHHQVDVSFTFGIGRVVIPVRSQRHRGWPTGREEMTVQMAEDSIVIDRPIAEVFAYVADTRSDPTWHTTVVQGRRTTPGPVGMRTTFEGIHDLKKHTLETSARPANFQRVRAVITESVRCTALRLQVEFTDPPHGVGARILGRSFDLTFRFEISVDGTRVFRAGEIHPVLLAMPLVPLVVRLNGGRKRYLLENLKRAVERREPDKEAQ